MADEVLVRLRGISKDYRGLRPLRIAEFEIRAGASLALMGLDAAMAEVFVDLVTGAVLPDTGEVLAFGSCTRDIGDPDAWIRSLDSFGLLTERAVLVEQFTVEQNLALPFTVAVDEIPHEVRRQVSSLAAEIGLDVADLGQKAGDASASVRLRIRLGRALALGPRLLVAEHPNATLTGDEGPEFASLISRVARARGLASLVLTADRRFAHSAAREVLELESSTGRIKPTARWRRWLS